MADQTDEQKRAQDAILAAFDQWAKTQPHPYPRGAFLAGAVWMAQTIAARMPTDDRERTPPPCKNCGGSWWVGDPPKCMRCTAPAPGSTAASGVKEGGK